MKHYFLMIEEKIVFFLSLYNMSFSPFIPAKYTDYKQRPHLNRQKEHQQKEWQPEH